MRASLHRMNLMLKNKKYSKVKDIDFKKMLWFTGAFLLLWPCICACTP